MSLTIDSPAPPSADPAPAPPAATPAPAGLWARAALAVALLAASGAVRYWQSRDIDELMRQGLVCPIDLTALPMTLGDWEGTEEVMDPQIAQNAGCTAHVFRTYTNTKTGARIGLILLYGPANEVFLHAPEKCYPNAGYTLVDGPERRRIEAGAGAARYPFTSLFFVKGEGGHAERQEVYYTWRYLGQWTPDLVVMKRIERIPGMFKVHLTRQAGAGELRGVGNPCESFLRELMPWVDGRLAEVASPSDRPAA